jgi:hypothetical protein
MDPKEVLKSLAAFLAVLAIVMIAVALAYFLALHWK